MTADLWQRACERLAEELPEHQFNTWIRPLPPAVLQDDVASVRVPNRFKLDWIRSQYARRIESVLSELAERPVRLELSLAAREPAQRPPAMALLRSTSPNATHALAALAQVDDTRPPDEPARERGMPSLQAPAGSRHKLNTALTFETL